MADVSPLGFDGHAVSGITPELAALVALMQEGAPAEDDGLTTLEWAQRIGRGEDATRTIIKKLLTAGLMRLGQARRQNMATVMTTVWVYRLVSKG